MDFRLDNAIKILKKNILVILAAALLFFGAAFAYMRFCVDPTYHVDAAFYIKDPETSASMSQNITNTRLLATTCIEVLDTRSFFQKVYDELASDPMTESIAAKYSPESLKAGASFQTKNETEVILLTFSSGDRETILPVVAKILYSIPGHLAVSYGDCSFYIVDKPVDEDDVAVSTGRVKTVCLIATVIGACAAFLIFFLRDMLDVHIKTADDITKRYGIPVLGTVPFFSDDKNGVKKTGGKSPNVR